MSGFTNYLRAKVMDHVLGETAYPMPTVYVGLYKTEPMPDGTGDEADYTGYSRVATAGKWAAAAADGTVSNSAVIEFPASTQAATQTVVGFALFDAATNGNMLICGSLNANKIIQEGDPIRFEIGALEGELYAAGDNP